MRVRVSVGVIRIRDNVWVRMRWRCVPLVMTPSEVYSGDCGFFLTPIRSSWKVAFSSGWVTDAWGDGREITGK